MFNSRLAPQSTAIFAMVRSSISNTIPKSQAPLPKTPSGPLGEVLAFLVFKRARQAFLSFAFLLFQASGDYNTKPFSQSQEVQLTARPPRGSLYV